jgi:hypothetical protein
MTIRRLLGVAAVLTLLQACAAVEPAEQGAESPDAGLLPPLDDSEAERCVSLARISSVKVLDNRSIEFRMKGGDVYINILPNPCPGLRPRQPFMYRTSLSELCDLDLITVLDQGGFGLRPMGSCGLGRFYPSLKGNPPVIGDDGRQD